MVHLLTLLLVLVLIAFSEELIRVVQDPTNGRFCEGTTARLSCIIFDNSTGRAANTTIWLNNTAIDSISDDRVKNIVDGDNVTSVLTLMDVSKDLNNSNYSCRPSRTIISSGAVITVIVPPVTAPNLTGATDLTRNSFTIKWTVTNSNNIHSYIITWSNLHNDDMDNIEVQANTTSYTVIGLNGVDNYNVSVAAKNPCGMMGGDSITVYDKPDAPINVRISERKNGSFMVHWDPVNDLFPITYTVQWYGEDNEDTATTNELSYTVTGLTSNTSYNVTVIANNTCCGAGLVSDAVVVTTATSLLNDGSVMGANGDGDDDNNEWIIVVIVVVSAAVVIIVAILVILFIRHRWRLRRGQTASPENQQPPPEDQQPAPEEQQPPPEDQQPLPENQQPLPLQPPAIQWKPLQIATVLLLLQPVESSWKELARYLLKDKLQHKVNTIEADCFHNAASKKALDEVFSKWLSCTEAAQRTWQTLCNTSKKYGDESLEQYMKKNDGLKGDGEPTMKHITRWSKHSPLRTCWYNFAVELVGKSNANIIKATYYGGGSHSCLQRVLMTWYDSTTNHSWQMIVDALRQMDETRVVESIEKECQM